MNAGAIWWGQIGNSLRLLTRVTNNLRDCRSAVLQVPQHFPWRQDFYESIALRCSAFGGERRLLRLSWEQGENPGRFVLQELCAKSVWAEYWPGQSYADYLASKTDILLNDYDVWITGVHTKEELVQWEDFMAAYHRATRDRASHAVFIIEYDGPPVTVTHVDNLVYTVENYDCRVFSLESASDLGNTDLRNYQAELALSICGGDPELCYALLMTGDQLLQDPVKATMDVLNNGHPSAGGWFDLMEDQQILSAVWEAAIVLLFPVLERYRMGFIEKHKDVLARYLPISNSNGEKVTDPCDLEIGALHHIVHNANKVFSPADVETIKLCRNVRNLLAHNKPVSLGEAKKVLALT